MPVKNATRKTLIASSSRVADSVFGRAIGLMFSRPTKTAMILEFSRDSPISLHTFFVFFPIDIILVDSRMRVVEMHVRMRPFTTFVARKVARLVIELPAGTIATSRTRVGDRIELLRVVEKRTGNGRHITVCRA